MKKTGLKSVKMFVRCITTMVVSCVLVLGMSLGVQADEADAKRLLKAMSDYMAGQQALSFEYDATLEIVTTDGQRLGLASSGTVNLKRPDKFHVTRVGGFVDVEMYFDAKTMTLLGKNQNLYTQLDVPGTIDHLVDELERTYDVEFPGGDLLLSNSYDELINGVDDIKDLGSGVIGGIECDHLAFRTEEVDWEIWIAQGEHPYPYRYVITSKNISGGPQYSIQTRNWKTGSEVPTTEFNFKNPTKADKVELKDLKDFKQFPDHFKKGEAK
jgi:hypothetical protein